MGTVIAGLLSLSLFTGFTNTPTQGTFNITYTEPSVQVGGSALASLTQCDIYVFIPGVLGLTNVKTVAATSSSGGGTVNTTATVAWGAVPSTALPLEWKITCTNSVGSSAFAPSAYVTLDPYPLQLFH